jgi:hypothetical protein
MHNDTRGLPIAAASAYSVQAFDHAIDPYLSYRSDIMTQMEALFAADPECGMAHTFKGYILPHWTMALAATGRENAAWQMLEAMHDYAQGPSINARLVGDVAIPVSQAILAHGSGQYAQAVALMRPVLGEMYRLGGSHAQQDVLEQVFLDAAMKAGLADDYAMLIERVSGRHPVPPARLCNGGVIVSISSNNAEWSDTPTARSTCE